ncbi:MAG: dioxygenase [Pseudobdellovibrionaceae bacterium]|nr:dioxygenase [Pseudobdellovibrionaceae bacterium]
MSPATLMPVLFVSHGAPTKALDREQGALLREWAATLPQPRGILVISAHWWEREMQMSCSDPLPTLHDFAGFGDELNTIQYPVHGFSIEQRALVQACVGPLPEVERGLDHGAWVPLMHMYPEASVPVLPLALRLRDKFPRFFELGQSLAPLRRQGILILASGSATHNLGAFEEKSDNVPAWVTDYEVWLRDRLLAGDKDVLIEPRFIQPLFRKNHPTNDHYAPLLVAMGAAWDGLSRLTFPIQGMEHAALSRLCIQFE